MESKFNQNDVFSLQVLNRLFNEGIFLPITSSSLRPSSLLVMVNDIIINRRSSVIEFGAGLSTIIFARLIKLNKLNTTIYSVDENLEWIDELSRQLEKENLHKHVNLIHAPLNDTGLSQNNTPWYSQTVINEKLSPDLKFDLVLIDGPSAWKEEIKLARFPALPFIANKLDNSFSIYLDDANRDGEIMVMDLWERHYNARFNKISDTLAGIYANTKFNLNI